MGSSNSALEKLKPSNSAEEKVKASKGKEDKKLIGSYTPLSLES